MRALRRGRGEAGTTLAELAVVMVLMTAIVMVFGPVLTSSMRAGREIDNESRAVDEIRIAVARLDRELRSACLVSAPALGATGSTLTFTTQTGSGGAYDVTYKVLDGRLSRQTTAGTEFVSEGLVVTSHEFSHTENNTGTRAQIALEIQARFEDGNTPRALRTTIAGRNTWSGCN